jgi:hypothetical protein
MSTCTRGLPKTVQTTWPGPCRRPACSSPSLQADKGRAVCSSSPEPRTWVCVCASSSGSSCAAELRPLSSQCTTRCHRVASRLVATYTCMAPPLVASSRGAHSQRPGPHPHPPVKPLHTHGPRYRNGRRTPIKAIGESTMLPATHPSGLSSCARFSLAGHACRAASTPDCFKGTCHLSCIHKQLPALGPSPPSRHHRTRLLLLVTAWNIRQRVRQPHACSGGTPPETKHWGSRCS